MKPEIIEAHCNDCLKTTNQELLSSHPREEKYEDQYREVITHSDFETLKCGGCGNIRFREVLSGTEIYDQEGYTKVVKYHPFPIFRRKPDWLLDGKFESDQEKLHSLFEEVYTAISAELYVLAGMGARTIVDVAMTSKVGDVGDFGTKLNKFVADQFISNKDKDLLRKTIDVGSASAHRGYTPTRRDINALLDVAENLVQRVFIHEALIEKVAKKVPPRPK